MGERSRVVAVIVILVVLSAVGTLGLTGCTREKPAPTPRPDWIPPSFEAPAATSAVPVPDITVAATVISADETPSSPAVVATSVPQAAATVELPTPSLEQPIPTPIQPAPAPSGSTFTYVVRAGETLYSIAQRFDSDVPELVRLNKLANADDIQAGQKVQIPGAGSPPGGGDSAATVIHVVQRGETLQAIALRYGVTTGVLLSTNELANPNRIYPGQRLTIPGSAAAPESGPRTHTVQPGETLSQIARAYGVTMAALQAENGISDADTISVGVRLTIP